MTHYEDGLELTDGEVAMAFVGCLVMAVIVIATSIVLAGFVSRMIFGA